MKVQRVKKSQFRSANQSRVSPPHRTSPSARLNHSEVNRNPSVNHSAEVSIRQLLTPPPRSSQPFIPTFFETPLLLQLPTELLTKLTTHLPFPSYIALAMTCKTLYTRLFSHEIIFYLKNRFSLNAQSGSMIVFAYQTGLITKAPRVCEAILDEFFNGRADDEASKSAVGSALSQASVSTAINTRKEQFKTVRFWAVLYALHRAIPVYFDTMLEGDGTTDLHGVPLTNSLSQSQATQNASASNILNITTQSSVTCLSTVPTSDTTQQRIRTTSPYFATETQHFKPPTSTQNLAFLEKYISYMHSASDGVIPHKYSINTTNSSSSSLKSAGMVTGAGALSPSVTLPSNIHTRKTYHTIFLHVLKSGDLDILEFYLRTYGPPFCNFRLRGDEYDDLEGLDLGGGPVDDSSAYVSGTSQGYGVTNIDILTTSHQQSQHHLQNNHPFVPASVAATWVFGNGNTDGVNGEIGGTVYGNTGKELRRKVKKLLEKYGVTVSDGVL
ncbi:hypothetical protein BC937DRAFT_86610 [Endogone sp. FLAS-F59071]|nr:hypothetical protein BC937DRAFT_86610 [Endogone sp. FLAS-F59071]|eukprot:RUS19987.1 hypothetical protein BC937DRAFT_86610 [Endogone sp. FLAS-F59071]